MLAGLPACVSLENMNGDYETSKTPNANNNKFPTQYAHYPRPVQSFDVYSGEIETLYSQVYWRGQDPVALPAEVIAAFANKIMAIVGFEIDQVRITPEGDVRVPINVAYNHHFESTMVGSKSSFEKVWFEGPNDVRLLELLREHGGHGVPSQHEHWFVRGGANDKTGAVPTQQDFGAANGGEARKSFHGFAPGFVQLIQSPHTIQITPMQIDTWHREKMNLTGYSPFVPGPLPRSSLAPKNALYSGLLECPISSRIETVVDLNAVMSETVCTQDLAMQSAGACFLAVEKFLGKTTFPIITDSGVDVSKPAGCSLALGDGSIKVYFNSATTVVGCASNTGIAGGSASSLVNLTLSASQTKQIVVITVQGPAEVWFGVGFNASKMGDSPWAIVMEANGNVTERKLQDQNPGALLPASVTVVSNIVVNGSRTVTMTRPMKGVSPDYYTFDTQAQMLPFINAVGAAATLSYHKNKLPSKIALLPATSSDGKPASGVCVCASEIPPFGQGKGGFVYHPVHQPGEKGDGQVNYDNSCPPEPTGDLLAQKNPTCDVRTYVGGQIVCHHMWSLLDADQDIPWVDQPLKYHLKMRFWYQEYDPLYHTSVYRTTWGIASPVEYDVPKCDEVTPGCSKAEDGSWIHTIHGQYTGHGKLVAAHFHCHAPTCLSVKMYRNDTGELLCEEKALYGKGRKEDYDEVGFIAVPPCLWGDAEYGLMPPPDLGKGTLMHSVKTANATNGHHGEMAWQQMFYA